MGSSPIFRASKIARIAELVYATIKGVLIWKIGVAGARRRLKIF